LNSPYLSHYLHLHHHHSDKDTSGQLVSRFFASTSKTPSSSSSSSYSSFIGTPLAPPLLPEKEETAKPLEATAKPLEATAKPVEETIKPKEETAKPTAPALAPKSKAKAKPKAKSETAASATATTDTPAPAEKAKKPKKDPKAPTGVRAAYAFFSSDFRVKQKKDKPEITSEEMKKALADSWNNITPEERAPFEVITDV
jgi:flagellar protein FliO/FliZ